MAFTTIDNPELYFQVKLYAGNSSTQAITLDGSEDMQPDFVWIKNRNDGSNQSHVLYDSVRGATKFWQSNSTAGEATDSNGLTAFGSDGFTLGNSAEENTGFNYSAFCWKESATPGFDIVSYTGNGSARTISHNLSAVPEWMLIKKTSGTDAGAVYVGANGNTNGLLISGTNANDDELYWNDTTPTSSVFTLGTLSNVNQNSETYIAYLFAPKQGFSKFGTYVGNANTNGTFIYTGFQPAWVMCKKSSGTGNWNITDTKRNTGNPHGKQFEANASIAEFDSVRLDILSNGFKHRATGSDLNGSGTSYIFIAFAEAPFVNSKGVPCNAR
tara:strand:+ start:470 stop:1453 length:984 start_codon:yes stop_codon:yes gene_type:complete